MTPNHIAIRIEQCLALAKASNCPRAKYGALLLDPERNVILSDGYNGAPRGGGELCGGSWCERDGLTRDMISVGKEVVRGVVGGIPGTRKVFLAVKINNKTVKRFELTLVDDAAKKARDRNETESPFYSATTAEDKAEAYIRDLLERHPPIKSGTEVQVGCHHAEMNVICNAAAGGIATAGAWMIVTGEPCLMCAKHIHHAGIVKILVVKGGYMGANGIEYLKQHGIKIQMVEGPQDPRMGG